MRLDHLGDVVRIERISFPIPWTREQFAMEIVGHPHADNRVGVANGSVCGYLCLWKVFDELRIHTIAVAPEVRRQGWARFLMSAMIADATEAGLIVATLEVRRSNRAARALYADLGFLEVGYRPRYYPGGTGGCDHAEPEDAILLDKPLGADMISQPKPG